MTAVRANSTILHRFDQEYFFVAQQLGIKLAPRDDPEKSFGPSTSGTVLGIQYDTEAWSWCLPQEKLIRLMHNLKDMLSVDGVEQKAVWTVVRKILNIMPLVPTGKYNVDHLIRANSESENRHHWVVVTPAMKRQLFFWYSIIPTCGGATSIPDPFRKLPPWALEVHSDAAGGTTNKAGHGVGTVMEGWWSYLPWSPSINRGELVQDGSGATWIG